MHNKFDVFEKTLKNLFENTVARLFPGDYLIQQLTHCLVKAIHSGIVDGGQGVWIAPARFTVALPAQVLEKYSEEKILAILHEVMVNTCQEAGYRQVRESVFNLVPSETGDIDVLSFPYIEETEQTQGIRISPELTGEPLDHPGAYLIASEGSFFPLVEGITHLGRLPDNHLVLDDLSVSRRHAQIRRSQGKYIIFDLDSRSGTYVNGTRIQQRELIPGDVIGLGNVKLIFALEDAPLKETRPTPSDPLL